ARPQSIFLLPLRTQGHRCRHAQEHNEESFHAIKCIAASSFARLPLITFTLRHGGRERAETTNDFLLRASSQTPRLPVNVTSLFMYRGSRGASAPSTASP